MSNGPSGDQAARSAPDVPTINPNRSGVVQLAPTLLQGPSPIAGAHGTFRSAGQRELVAAGVESISGLRCRRSIPIADSTSSSHSHVCTSISPVPEAIDTLTPLEPV